MADMTKVQDQVSTYAEYLPQPIVQKQIFFLTSSEIRDESVLVQLYDLIKAHPTYQAYPVHWSVYKLILCAGPGSFTVIWVLLGKISPGEKNTARNMRDGCRRGGSCRASCRRPIYWFPPRRTSIYWKQDTVWEIYMADASVR